jgi:hypothetical protein
LKEIKPENVEMFDALIAEPRNLQIAMDFAHGSESRAIQSNPEVLLEKMTQQLTAEATERFGAEKKELLSKHKKELAENLARQQKLALQLAELETEKQKNMLQNVNRVRALFDRYCKRRRTSATVAKWGSAAIVLIIVFITSNVLLEPLDKRWKSGWTLVLSIIAGLVPALAIVYDPRSLIESLTTRWPQTQFRNEVRRQNLVEALDTIELDWTNCVGQKKSDSNSSLL